jgi:hypothetical protein
MAKIIIHAFEAYEVEFERSGKVFDPSQVKALLDGVAASGVTDLVVMSHGWNNDMKEARALYSGWLASLRASVDDPACPVKLAGRKIAFAGVLWPSKRFTDDELIPGGGAASLEDERAELARKIDGLKTLYTTKGERAELAKLKKLLPKLETEASARRAFVDTLRGLVTDGPDEEGDTTAQFFKLPGQEVFEKLATGSGRKKSRPADEGGAAGLGDFFRNAWDAARNVLNCGTYYEMKARAGLVGSLGLHSVLEKLQARSPSVRIHLVGHSFGGRVVASAADGPDHVSKLRISSMTLLQAAFSHNGFAKKFDGKRNGFFRAVLADARIDGPILVTHTKNDKAVGVAYPLASRLNGDDAAGLGDRDDVYGGIGSNGAVKTPESIALKLLPANASYSFAKNKLYNLEAGKFVKSHGDVAGRQVAYATLCAIAGKP